MTALPVSMHPAARRLGRPPASVGDNTRTRILDAARLCFADRGYDGTTTRQIAEAAELTTAAIYHYFSSKAELYVAAQAKVHEFIYARYDEAVVGRTSLVEEFRAVLDASHAMNRADPSLARFLVAARTDERRHPELAMVADSDADPTTTRGTFHTALVGRAVERGEIAEADAPMITDTLRTMLGGLVYHASEDLEMQARVIRGLEALLRGTLLTGDRIPAGAD